MRMLLSALFVALCLHPASASAQRGRARARERVIELDIQFEGAQYGPHPFVDHVVVPADPCPAATWLAACGGPPPASGECPSLRDAALSLGEARIASCTPTPALVGVAEALADDLEPGLEGQPSSIERAQRIYRSLASLDALRGLALHRAAMLAREWVRYAEALAIAYEILAAPRSEAFRLAAREMAASLVAYEDHDEDQRTDDGYPRVRISALPDAAFARDIAVNALAATRIGRMHEGTLEMIAAILERWPDTPTEALDREAARALREAPARTAALVEHLVAAAGRCRVAHATCDTEHLDELTAIAVEGMRACGTAGAALDPRRIEDCRLGAERARRALALRASAELEADATLAEAWVVAAEARRRAERARPRSRAERRPRANVLATPLPPDVTPRTAITARAPRIATLSYRYLRGARRRLHLDRCAAPRGGTEVIVRARWGRPGQPVAFSAEPAGALAACVQSAVAASVREMQDEDSVGTVLVLFPPR